MPLHNLNSIPLHNIHKLNTHRLGGGWRVSSGSTNWSLTQQPVALHPSAAKAAAAAATAASW